jgi:prophage regulatory protein
LTERFINMEEVRRRVALSKTEIYRKMAAGKFPRPVPLGTQKVAFVESEVVAWMEARLAAREAQEGVERRSAQGRVAQAASYGGQGRLAVVAREGGEHG